MIKQRKREELYDLFRQGAIPSGADFADLIRSQLNLLDDGLEISDNADDPICFRAHGKGGNFLDLADAAGDTQWRLSGYDEAVTAKGLNFTANEQSKLFIEQETGNIGINTDEPQAKLHLIQISATPALRIDDKGSDDTPLIVTAEGQVGLGTPSPSAKLHLSYSGSGDILRVDDTEADTTPLIIDDTGNVGLGYSNPQTKLAVAGGMAVGTNRDPGVNNLYIAGNIVVEGTAVFSGGPGVGGIEINAPLSSGTNEVTIEDNVVICGDADQEGSDGNLSVAGNTTLGTYQAIKDNWNVLTVNGRIRAGGDVVSGAEQYEMEVNDIFSVDRNPAAPQAKLQGNLSVSGNTALGDSQADNIYLNGVVSSRVGGVVIDDDLRITGNTVVGDAKSDSIVLNGKISSDAGDVVIDDNLVVTESATFGKAATDKIYLNGTVSSAGGAVVIDAGLQVSGSAVLGDSQADQIYLNGVVSSTAGDIRIDDNLAVAQTATLHAAVIDSLKLSSDPTVNRISTDPKLSGNSNEVLPTEQAVKEYIDNLLAGSIAAFGMTAVPEGWLECNGQTVSRTEFARLFRLIGIAYGEGNGSTTFNVPNLRNQFLRGHLPGARIIGTNQSAASGSHVHSFSGQAATISGGDHSHVVNSALARQRALCGYSYSHSGGRLSITAQWGYYLLYNQGGTTYSASHNHSFTPSGNINGAVNEEPRPSNTAVMFCIKY
jgi:cytoskeletal protein CcmA (bactofilin family)